MGGDERVEAMTGWHALGVLAVLLALLLASCTASTESTPDAGTAAPDAGSESPDGSVVDPDAIVGRFQIRLVAPVPATETTAAMPGLTSLVGKVYDGPAPSQLVWEESAAEGACRLLTPRVPFCEEPCGGGAACVENDVCQAYPASHAVGAVRATGLKTRAGATTFSMDPIANTYQPSGDVELAYPAFAEGDALELAAAGSTFTGAFVLQARGIAPLSVTDDALAIESGAPLALHWEPAGIDGLSAIHVKLDISHHGGTKGMIECDAPDSGQLEIPAALLSRLTSLGVAGFPSIVISRNSSGSTAIAAGRVELVVSSEVERGVQIPGLASCTSDSDCADGKSCRSDLTCG